MDLPMVWSVGLRGFCGNELQREAAMQAREFQLSADWCEADAEKLREKIWKSCGIAIDHTLDLDMRTTGSIRREGHTLHKIHYQSRESIRVTGTLSVPDGEGPFPGILILHGHHSEGHLAGPIQCLAELFARRGYVTMTVDVIGAGERDEIQGKYDYHGGNLGGSLLQLGETLLGFQLVDNMRAVDLLCSLPYVDPTRIGVTGSSGGGNQTMWIAAMDTRVKAACPVVSAGTFESYVMSPNCMCELLPGGLTFTEESSLFAMTAPRALMPCNGLFDKTPSFLVTEMLRSVEEARIAYKKLGKNGSLKAFVANRGHEYGPAVKEAVLGFMDRHLKGITESDDLVSLPDCNALPAEEIMTFEPGKRPEDFMTLPKYLEEGASRLKAQRKEMPDPAELEAFLAPEKVEDLRIIPHGEMYGWKRFTLRTRSGLLPMLERAPVSGNEYVIIASPGGKKQLQESVLFKKLDASGKGLCIIDVWGCGEFEANNKAETFPNMINYTRSLIWLGKCIQSYWLTDYRCAAQALQELHPGCAISSGGYADSAIAASLYAALEKNNVDLYLEKAPASLGWSQARDDEYEFHAWIIPGILKLTDMDQILAAAGGTVLNLNVLE